VTPLEATAALEVRLGTRTYPILFGRDLRSRLAAEAAAVGAAGSRLAAVTDANLERVQAAALDGMLPGIARVAVEPGEKSKSLEGLGRVLDFMAEERLDRRSVLVAVGGGVVGDLAGFAAAAYLRGIAFWQVPTTLLAMVDSSVGGKTGINLAAGKNLVGAFHQPAKVFIDTAFLDTLPPREFAAGMAEVIKYGLIGDADLLAGLEREPLTVASADLAEVIRRCCAAKARVVEADEFERAAEGGRALLNLGHTFGHAIEQVTGYGAYLHGEAVAVGLAAAARLSRELGLIGASDVGRIDAVLAAHALPTRLRAPLPWTALREAMGRDKKVRAGRLRFVVVESFGVARTRDDVPEAPAEMAFREVGAA
jgi:3-dehydroquinate synthase